MAKFGLLILSIVAVLIALQPAFASAGSSNMSERAIERLCERQEKLGHRLSRPLIDPSYCHSGEPEVTLSFEADPEEIDEGDSSELTWDSDNATTCVASNGWSGTKSLSGSQAVSPDSTTTYTLMCSKGSSSVTRSVTVQVDEVDAPEITFSASPTTIQQGNSSTLSWSTTNATSCTASGGWSGTKGTSGTQVVSPSATTTYMLACTGLGGSDNASVTVNVILTPTPQPVLTFTASPLTIAQGATSTLTWSATNATDCVASNGWSGSKGTSGTLHVTPSATTTYLLLCTGQNGTDSESVTVNVVLTPPEPVVTLVAAPTSVTPGAGTATTTLTWTSTNATSCTASGGAWTGSKVLNGTEIITPSATTTYTLNCSGPGGSDAASTTVTFVPAPIITPTLNFSATPTSVTPGAGTATSTLTWTSSNVTFCTSSNGWSGERATSGSLIVTPLATTTYQLSCGGTNGTTTQNVTIHFVPTPPALVPTLNFVASPTSVTPGAGSATSTLTWVTTNVSFCAASNGWSGTKATSSSQIVTPLATTTYQLDCGGVHGTTTQSVTINFVPTPVQSVGHLLISEVHYNPDTAHGKDGSPDDNEWVEIYNPTGSSVNLTNWWIGDTATSSVDKIPDGTIIPAGGYLVVSQSSTTPSFWPSAPSSVFVSLENPIGGGLANSSDAVFLLNANGATSTIDAVSWGANTMGLNPSVTNVADGHSIARSSLLTDSDTAGDWIDRASPTFGL